MKRTRPRVEISPRSFSNWLHGNTPGNLSDLYRQERRKGRKTRNKARTARRAKHAQRRPQ